MVVFTKAALKVGGRIDVDAECRSCGYNLRGLTWGRACPECGEVAPQRSRLHDTLVAGGDAGRQRWLAGLTVAAICICVAMAGRMVFFITCAPGIIDDVAMAYLVVLAINAAAWTVAAWLLTPLAILDGRPWLRVPRLAARGLALLWVPAYVCLIVRYANTGLPSSVDTVLLVGDRLGRLLAGVGVMFLAFILSYLAGEAELERAERRLNAAVWLLWVPTLLAQAFPEQIAWFTLILLGMVLLVWCWVMTIMLLGVIELRQHVRWAGVHGAESMDRQERIVAKRREMEEEVAGTVRPVGKGGGDVPLR